MTWPAWLQRDSPFFLVLLFLAALGAAFRPVRGVALWLGRLIRASSIAGYRKLRDLSSKKELAILAKVPDLELKVAQLLTLQTRVEALERDVGDMRAEIAGLPEGFARLEQAAERTERTVASLAETLREELGTLTRIFGDELRRRRLDTERL